MKSKHSFAVVVAATSATVVALIACSNSSGGAAPADAGADAAADTSSADAAEASSDVVVDAPPCSNVPVADGDVYTMCLVQSCCFQLTQCTKDCNDYKACVVACAQTDAASPCFDQCAMQHSNGQLQLHSLDDCGNQHCSPVVRDH